jgi:hypothetical protein
VATESLWGAANVTLTDPVEPLTEPSPWGTAESTLIVPTPAGTSYWGTASTTLGDASEWWVRHDGEWVPLVAGVSTQ